MASLLSYPLKFENSQINRLRTWLSKTFSNSENFCQNWVFNWYKNAALVQIYYTIFWNSKNTFCKTTHSLVESHRVVRFDSIFPIFVSALDPNEILVKYKRTWGSKKKRQIQKRKTLERTLLGTLSSSSATRATSEHRRSATSVYCRRKIKKFKISYQIRLHTYQLTIQRSIELT